MAATASKVVDHDKVRLCRCSQGWTFFWKDSDHGCAQRGILM